jgi:hypothetical protein
VLALERLKARIVLLRQNHMHRTRRRHVLGALEAQRREVDAREQGLALA